MTANERIRRLNQAPEGSGSYVLYWMQRSQRAQHNHALEFAVDAANERRIPIIVVFAVTDSYPEANERHFQFMLEGLADVRESLADRGIDFFLKHGHPTEVIPGVARNARLMVCDRAYLRHLRAWRRDVAEAVSCPVYEVEDNVVVPVEQASRKREFAARTIRRKIMSQVDAYTSLPQEHRPQVPLDREDRARLGKGCLDPRDPAALCRSLSLDRSVGAVSRFYRGGAAEGMRRARELFENRLGAYVANRNQPKTDDTSHASMYLHFGNISPIWLVLEVRRRAAEAGGERVEDGSPETTAQAVAESADSFVEELVVRRELAHNYVFYEDHYDSYSALPPWALQTLSEHAADERPQLYSPEELAEAATEDEYWNAATREMITTGYMHNYMRMYWGKKILEWSPDPETAFNTTLEMNNRYFLDGRDPNSYANVAWIFGLHDRPWQERPIFGKVRIMKASGLKRKCDMPGYLAKVDRLSAGAADGPSTQGELFR